MVNVGKVGEKYRCNICGNEVKVTKVGGGELICCGGPWNYWNRPQISSSTLFF